MPDVCADASGIMEAYEQSIGSSRTQVSALTNGLGLGAARALKVFGGTTLTTGRYWAMVTGSCAAEFHFR
jgi:hypothetical protein